MDTLTFDSQPKDESALASFPQLTTFRRAALKVIVEADASSASVAGSPIPPPPAETPVLSPPPPPPVNSPSVNSPQPPNEAASPAAPTLLSPSHVQVDATDDGERKEGDEVGVGVVVARLHAHQQPPQAKQPEGKRHQHRSMAAQPVILKTVPNKRGHGHRHSGRLGDAFDPSTVFPDKLAANGDSQVVSCTLPLL